MRRTIQRAENGNWHAGGEACPWARVIVFGWQDLAILNGAPVARRMFIDGFAARLYAGHLPALLRYRRLIGQRNRLLQSHATAERLAPWDEQLATVGMELIDRRRRAVAILQT
jgi:DNA replication and repair protein RecF